MGGEVNEYWVINVNEDGEVRVRKHSMGELLKLINEVDFNPDRVRDTLQAHDYDPQCWGNKTTLIICGHIVVPEPVERVTEYRIGCRSER